MTFAENLDPDEAPKNMGPHLRYKLFKTQIITANKFDHNHDFLLILKERKEKLEEL